DIEVQMDRGMLTIKGERRSEAVGATERYARVERVHGGFHRRFALPDSADPERITASGSHGVLRIVIPKKAESTPRRIQVDRTLDAARERTPSSGANPAIAATTQAANRAPSRAPVATWLAVPKPASPNRVPSWSRRSREFGKVCASRSRLPAISRPPS